MIKQSDLIFYVIITLTTTINLCLSKPTPANGTFADHVNFKEIIQNLSENSEVNIISREDSDYRSNYAAKMLSYMNLSVSPCNDFYEYACGNWKNVIEDRMSLSKRDNIMDIVYKIADIIENILQRNHINDVAPEYAAEFELAKQIYNNCLKAELYPMRASTEYLEVLREIGGFPAVDTDWNDKTFNWLNMSAHLSNYGVKNLINEGIITGYPFPPFFKMPDFGFDIELHYETIGNSSSNAYKENEKRMRDILTIYGVEKNRLDGIITEIFEFLKKILKVLQTFNEDDAECAFLSNLMEESKIAAVAEKWRIYNEIAWLGKNFEKVIDGFETCCKPCYFLYEKVDQICAENKQAAANYLSMKFLFHMDARLKDSAFQKDFCILSVKSSMQYFFDHLYMKLYFSDELSQEVSEIIREIRQSLRIILQNANWLDEPTRKAALLKESTIVEHIGRYENENITKLLIGELKKLQFINGSYDANNLNLRKFKQYITRFNGLNFEMLSNDTKPLDLLVGMQVNSFYYNIDNSIYVMAGALMAPIYNKAWPNSLKFGTLGFLIGHEFTHGFDTVGAHYDEAGSENYWWSTKSGKVFKERSNCYVDHYQSYLIPEINRNINGNLTKDENIADGGGLREALMAYRRYIKNITKDLDSISVLSKEEQMPGIDLSPEQLFFLGFTQLWCASYKEADYWEELTNEHAVDKYRVLGALSNNDDFTKAYNCPLGSKMNPLPNKCEVW